MKNHETQIVRGAEGLEIVCSCGEVVPGVYFTLKKAQRAAASHKMYTSADEDIATVKGEIEKIAKASKTFTQFHDTVLKNRRLAAIVGRKTLQHLIQHNETGMQLDN